jgi:hypothetical protein
MPELFQFGVGLQKFGDEIETKQTVHKPKVQFIYRYAPGNKSSLAVSKSDDYFDS